MLIYGIIWDNSKTLYIYTRDGWNPTWLDLGTYLLPPLGALSTTYKQFH